MFFTVHPTKMFMAYPAVPNQNLPKGRTNITASLVYKASPGVSINDVRHEKTDLKVFVIIIPKEGWARVAAPILLV